MTETRIAQSALAFCDQIILWAERNEQTFIAIDVLAQLRDRLAVTGYIVIIPEVTIKPNADKESK